MMVLVVVLTVVVIIGAAVLGGGGFLDTPDVTHEHNRQGAVARLIDWLF